MKLHLNYEWAQWQALPWHLRRTYLEELAADGKLNEGGDDGEVPLSDLAEGGVQIQRG